MLFSLIENLRKVDIVLASASPRRYELLKNIGLEFIVDVSRLTEEQTSGADPQECALANARLKGQEVARRNPECLVISADTIVTFEQEDTGTIILGKPANEAAAYDMLRALSGKTHRVVTAFGLLMHKYGKEVYDTVTTDVTFRRLTDDEIWAYINTGEPLDKAGAYGIQGQGALLIEGISGCYFNVVGFPLSRLYLKMEAFLKPFVW